MNEGLARSERCAETLAILSEPDRLRIVRLLAAGPRTVGEVAELLDAPLGNASHHLRSVWLANLLSREKRGRHVLYSLRAGILSESGGGSAVEIRRDPRLLLPDLPDHGRFERTLNPVTSGAPLAHTIFGSLFRDAR